MSVERTALNRERVLATLRDAQPRLQREYGVARLSVFCSRLRGTARTDSDLDVLVELDRTPGFFRFVALEDELTQLLGLRVDLVLRRALRPAIGARVLAEAVPV